QLGRHAKGLEHLESLVRPLYGLAVDGLNHVTRANVHPSPETLGLQSNDAKPRETVRIVTGLELHPLQKASESLVDHFHHLVTAERTLWNGRFAGHTRF